MARIRSIKPDFFTSETIAGLPLSTRLTFIGLWTHVDDNGVTLDNPRLITAAVWPLEDDPRETLQRTQEDLERLSAAGLVYRYEDSGKRYLFVCGWDEHQRVSHPAKPRYPRPSKTPSKPPTSANTPPPENLPTASGEPPEVVGSPPEILAPEQGAGSREQGAGKGSRERAARESTNPRADEEFELFYGTFPRRVGRVDARRAWDRARKKAPAEVITAAAARYRDQPGREDRFTAHPATWLNGERWNDEPAAVGTGRNGRNGHQPYRDPATTAGYHGDL